MNHFIPNTFGALLCTTSPWARSALNSNTATNTLKYSKAKRTVNGHACSVKLQCYVVQGDHGDSHGGDLTIYDETWMRRFVPVHYCIGERLKLEGETENVGV